MMKSKKDKIKWVNLAEEIDQKYLEENVTTGKVLGFKNNNKTRYFKVVRINKKAGKYWAKRINLYDENASGELEKRA